MNDVGKRYQLFTLCTHAAAATRQGGITHYGPRGSQPERTVKLPKLTPLGRGMAAAEFIATSPFDLGGQSKSVGG